MNRLLPRLCLLIVFSALLTSVPGYCKTSIHISNSIHIEPTVYVYTGKVLGKSGKAKHLCLEVGEGDDSKIVPISLTADTRGLEHAVKGDVVLVRYTEKDNRIYATEIKPRLAPLPAGVEEMDVGDLKELIDNKEKFTLIDSRPAASFLSSHPPGAVSIPYSRIKRSINALPLDKNSMLVFYGQGDTSISGTRSALMAVQSGYTNVYVILEGVTAWLDEEYPVYADDQFILQGNIVLVDLRSEDKDTAAHIPGSVSMPFTEIEDYIDEISKKAPVVLYSDDDEQALEALQFFRDEGYTKVALVQGGIEQWKERGGKLISGSALQDVLWKRVPDPGEVSVQEFKAGLNDSDHVIVLDVREDREVQHGKFDQSYNLPLSDLSSQMDDFFAQIGNTSKQKKIFTHCRTGSRAEMAYRELKQDGYNVQYLSALVICKGDKCRIIE